ncbi:helix-turn-helix domain-containing protein [Streptomyces sp. NPDC053560]|uniref:helix-turn-helix domain-containing protein n=1 Tax=Streptomyces sp. NPDC053560 TaxID=3365711 RepID=UPI0037D750F4
MTPIYLSPDTPNWRPKSEEDIRSVVDGGMLSESNRLDAKKELKTKGDNKELARDLASFAIDGGTLIIGVDEDKEQRRFVCTPQPLKGLAEKIDDVARTVPDPPLNVITDEIPSVDDPTTGYVLVHVPPNPQAPHMVDGRYFGRNDKQKHVLTDADVFRLHARRRSGEQDALTLLAREMSDDPMRDVGKAHLFLVAQPMAGRDDMLLDLTSGQDWNYKLAQFLPRVSTPELDELLAEARVYPEIGDATNGSRRAGGAAKSSPCLADGRVYQPGGRIDPDAIEIQFFEDGGLRLFQSRLSDELRPGLEVIIDAAPVSLLRRFLALVTAVAGDTGYLGSWALAAGATSLRGKVAHSTTDYVRYFGQSPTYDQDDYQRATAASWAELTASPGAVTRRLIGPLLRTLGCEERWMNALTDSAPPT